MRDLLLMAVILPCIPVALFNPYFGVLAYVWVGLMNPHRFVYRLSNFPVAFAFAVATMAGMVITRRFGRYPVRAEMTLILLWFIYTTTTCILALNGVEAWTEWDRFSKILLMCLVVALLLQEKTRLHHLIAVMAVSIGFFGFKGGIFSILTKGNYMVFGPRGSFIEGNNELALAELMILPLILYFIRQEKKGWRRQGLQLCFFLTMVSAVFSYSRGALIALAGVSMLLAWRSKYRTRAIAAAMIGGALLIVFAPKAWTTRMATTATYQQDPSAMGRINAWHFAFNLANDRPIGGGFKAFTPELFTRWAPDPSNYHDAHSIYFEVLGEQGYPGLAIFLGIMVTSLMRMQRLRKRTRREPRLKWVKDMAEMLQCSILAYALGGAFLGLAYFDLYYYLVIAGVLLDVVYGDERRKLEEADTATAEVAPAPARVPAMGPLPAPRPA
ncbi:MAG TPA: putative O-glycosylation ligase, exosortase A system-associated [Candidatus Polarisedimenticolia bacterium]|nr:putative O-glycosylation ligase, exosortase A system-associated [Candidatus Polarisedimenticolia bacterium]